MVNVKVFDQKDYLIDSDFEISNNTSSSITLDDVLERKQYVLSISRHEPMKETNLTLDSWVVIDKIIIDDFWQLNENNFPSYSYYDNNYFNTAKANGATWELEKYRYNNVLFFNGKIDCIISTPIRGMFWQ